MELKDAISVINGISRRRRGKQLCPGEEVAVTAAWSGINYEDAIAMQKESFSTSYVGSQCGPDIWRLLSEELNVEVSKKRFRRLLEERYACNEHDAETGVHVRPTRIIGVPPVVDEYIGYGSQIKDCVASVLDQRNIFIDGPKGVGKTSLAAQVIKNISSIDTQTFDVCIWKSLYYGPLLSELLADLVGALDIPVQHLAGTENLLSSVIQYFRMHRCLLVLDEAQILLKASGKDIIWDQYEERYKGYGIFFRRMLEEQNSSSLIVTSRIRFPDWVELNERGSPVSIIRLSGLGDDAQLFLKSKKLKDRKRWPSFIDKYGDNPLILKIVANEIKALYGSSVSDFLDSHSTIVANSFLLTLNTEFDPSSAMTQLQAIILITLADLMQSMSSVYYEDLANASTIKKNTDSRSAISEAIAILVGRSLVEKTQNNGRSQFSLTPIVQKYIQSDPLHYVQKKVQDLDA